MIKLVLISVLVSVSLNMVSADSVIQNGSFETGDFTAWTASGSLNVLDFVGGSGSATPSDGVYAVNMNGGNRAPDGELSQSFAADIATVYSLTFDFAKGGTGSGTAALDIKVVGLGILLDEGISESTGGFPGAYSSYEFLFTADSTDLLLSFSDSSSGTVAFDGVLDNISVRAIPEASSATMISLVSGCALFVRRIFSA